MPSSPPPPPSLVPRSVIETQLAASHESSAASGAEGEATMNLSLDMVLRLVLRHGFWVLLCIAIGPALASLWVNRQTRWYQAQSTIVYDMSQQATLGRSVNVYDPYSDYINKQEMLETEFHIIISQRVLRQVVADAGLDFDRAFLTSTFGSSNQVKPEDIADVLRGRLKVEGVKNTSIARLSYEDTDPARAQRMLSTIIDTYIRVSNEDGAGTTGHALEWLQEQVLKLRGELEASEGDLHKFKSDRNLLSVSINDQNNLLRSEIAAVQSAVTEVNIKRARLMSRANALSKVSRDNPDDLSSTDLLADKTLDSMRAEFLKARSDLGQLKTAGKLENHPDVQTAQTHYDQSLDALLKQVRLLQSTALREAAVVSSEAGSLQGMLDNARKRALDLNLEEIKYNRLQRATTTSEKLYTNVLERMKEVDISRMINVKNIKPLDPPRLPVAPIRPVVGNIMAIGAGIGLFVGLLIAVLRELADRTVRTPTDIEQKLGVTCLGLLPTHSVASTSGQRTRRRDVGVSASTETPELVVARQPTSLMAEAARSIRSNITFMSPDRPPQMLMVTSANASEGKTTTAVTMATTFAQTGARTLIVDLDLRRPRIHKIFQVGLEHGITSVLLGEETLDEAIQATDVPNLSVLPAGRVPPNPAELLMSEKLYDLLQQLRTRYDRVIVDSPPVSPVTDAVILSTRTDGVVFVVRSHSTTVDQARHSLRSIRSVKGRVLGVILNAVDLRRLEYKYSYNYRYYTGYGDYNQGSSKANS